eukprot:CAMPEP_0172925836 /NCGR_PEP_ID=MMETSP1075-20121228/214465_1 /TAXON_ID=2916 /ORGANISM="Ceratium fusus, Strain PA161109" /LENGTH=108 /DNA_ID=CAMNT_0013786783 /DNA_START=314 /DNA_END=641 /DNA_ORIENTATION=-
MTAVDVCVAGIRAAQACSKTARQGSLATMFADDVCSLLGGSANAPIQLRMATCFFVGSRSLFFPLHLRQVFKRFWDTAKKLQRGRFSQMKHGPSPEKGWITTAHDLTI